MNRAEIAETVDIDHPRARFLLGLGRREWEAGRAVAPERLTPAYIRDKVAETPRKVVTEL